MKRPLSFLSGVAALALATGCGTRTPGVDPHVVSTNPANGELGVPANTSVTVTFDHAMQATSITTSTSGTACAGTLQLSSDSFVTCVRMAASPVASNGGFSFTVTPAAPLTEGTNYKLKVRAGASSAQGKLLASDFVTPDGFTVGAPVSPTPTPGPTPYEHTIVIDGTNDFDTAREKFTTTSANYFGYVAWDASNFYFAMSGGDVNTATNPQFKWVVAYFGGAGGTTTGVNYDDAGAASAQQPGLPFPAKWHLGWRADGNFTQALVWTGSAWASTSWNFTGDIYRMGTYVEFKVPLARIGDPSDVPFVMSMVNEEPTHEATYAGVPHDAFTDGVDPDFAHWYDFSLTTAAAPSAQPEH